MKSIRLHHYFAGVILCSAYCIGAIHIWHEQVPTIVDHSAHYLALPVILPFMLYQETVYLTPSLHDFPYFMAIYPIYFSLLFAPLAYLVFRNRKSTEYRA